jgi:hypothetical protein
MNQHKKAACNAGFTGQVLPEESILDRLYEKGFVPSDVWMELLMDFLTHPIEKTKQKLLRMAPENCLDLLHTFFSSSLKSTTHAGQTK